MPNTGSMLLVTLSTARARPAPEPGVMLKPLGGAPQVDLTALPDGTLLLALNPNATARSPLALATSRDGGATWRRVAVLEDDPDSNFHYPTVIFMPGRGGARVRAPPARPSSAPRRPLPPPQASSCAAAAARGRAGASDALRAVCADARLQLVMASICTLGVCWNFAMQFLSIGCQQGQCSCCEARQPACSQSSTRASRRI